MLAPKNPQSGDDSTKDTDNSIQEENRYIPEHRYPTRNKSSKNEVVKRPENLKKEASKRPKEKTNSTMKRPRKFPAGVGGEPIATSYVNSAYIDSEFIVRVLENTI